MVKSSNQQVHVDTAGKTSTAAEYVAFGLSTGVNLIPSHIIHSAGAILIGDDSEVYINGSTDFIKNQAGDAGGEIQNK